MSNFLNAVIQQQSVSPTGTDIVRRYYYLYDHKNCHGISKASKES